MSVDANADRVLGSDSSGPPASSKSGQNISKTGSGSPGIPADQLMNITLWRGNQGVSALEENGHTA